MTPKTPSRFLLALALSLLASACSQGYAPGADDAATTDTGGLADGGFDTGTDDAARHDADGDAATDTAPEDTALEDATLEDAGADSAPSDTGGADGGGSTCDANHDGVIARQEVPLRPGLTATFRVAQDVTVDTHGTEAADGTRTWDLSQTYDGDHATLIELMALSGAWYAPQFPDADYASRLSDAEDELGVFRLSPDALYLEGVVTPDDGLTRTELDYDPGAKILAFPLALGDTWSTESDVSGWYLGGYWTATETYSSQVDAAGELTTPFGTFEVLRVRTTLERQVGWQTTTIRSFAFVAECFGTVATVTSTENEDAAEFTQAAEVKRIAP